MFTLGDTVEIAEGRLRRPSSDGADLALRRAVHDSRRVRPGDLFVALPGSRTDGHRHLEEAYARGARAALVRHTEGIPQTATNLVVVEGPLRALYLLAAAWRARLTGTFVAVTGTCGKTGTRAVAAELLRGTHEVYSSPENYNTEIGVPLAVLEMEEGDDVGLFELGTERPG
ncbi:MAG: UDP-N-acetylmuramoylalanyl-D-glutamate--2,6-diaminopimelate ligase, partial [Candidatus Bipolaricaulota bacterium]